MKSAARLLKVIPPLAARGARSYFAPTARRAFLSQRAALKSVTAFLPVVSQLTHQTRLFSNKAIREHDGKKILAKFLEKNSKFAFKTKFCQVFETTDLDELAKQNPWLKENKLVVKIDQLIKRRGKNGLLKLDCTWAEAQAWLKQHRGLIKEVQNVKGKMDSFIIETYLPHEQADEYYLCINANRDGDTILFSHQGGINVGDIDAKGKKLQVPIGDKPDVKAITKALLQEVPKDRHKYLSQFIQDLFGCYSEANFAYMELNPILINAAEMSITPLDMAAKLDDVADFESEHLWEGATFPAAFGRPLLPEEQYIKDLDAQTGSSLKLTILNPAGRIWTMVAGGGASVIYADTIGDLGGGPELANYGEYSGDPSEHFTYEYAKTILDLMTRQKHPDGKILLIGGGISNFTDVAKTFKGIVRALSEYSKKLNDCNVKIYVRRGGPNYKEGLAMMSKLNDTHGLNISVHGPETNLTTIVPLALGVPLEQVEMGQKEPIIVDPKILKAAQSRSPPPPMKDDLYTPKTQSFVYGMQTKAVQRMLDFDNVGGRTPSVSAIIYPMNAEDVSYQKFWFGKQEIMIPVYRDLKAACKKFPEVDAVVNFASQRSAHQSVIDILEFPQIRSIGVIAEGIPERRTRQIIKAAKSKGVTIVGPATVGGIKPGCFRIGNAAGSMENIISCGLYKRGSVAYVSRSGGLSNELNNIIGRYTDGVHEGVAIGGDKYPASTFVEHLERYERNPDIKMTVILGEVGGTQEYEIIKARKEGKITKPMVGWCTGTCAKLFPYSVQFGHAGASAEGESETADAKNKALRDAGVVVPEHFEEFGSAIGNLYKELVLKGDIIEKPPTPKPLVPTDYAAAQALGLVRKGSNFITTITDERGEELMYHDMPISKVFEKDIGIGGTLGLLWFKKRLPDYASKFLEMVLQVTADHGPAVSGAHNTIVATRAGKDLISSLCSGLLCIGPRFGGALDDCARQMSAAVDAGIPPEDFVNQMKKEKKLIMGIGHKIKSLKNPDKRVECVTKFVKEHFPKTDVLDYAMAVQDITTKKKATLILNVDGCIAVSTVDLLRNCGLFSHQEAKDYIDMGVLNGMFVLGRSVGFIGHYLDQKRLKQPLYRHPHDDILYDVAKPNFD